MASESASGLSGEGKVLCVLEKALLSTRADVGCGMFDMGVIELRTAVVVAVVEVASSDTREVTTDTAVADKLDCSIGFTALRSNSSSELKSGKNFVHQKAILSPRSTIRCFKMNNTTRRKKTNPEMIRIRSSQSDFSSAVMSCLEVDITLSRTSCWRDVERRVAVEESSICVVRTERSSSACIRETVRRRASVTSELAFMRTLSLQSY